MRIPKKCLAPLWAICLCLASSMASAKPPVQKITPSKPEPVSAVVTAEELMADFSLDFVTAGAKWSGKTVEVTGFCIFPNAENLFLAMVAPQFGINCSFQKSAQKALAGLKTGQCVTVVGKIGYYASGLPLTCYSVKPCTTKPEAISADDLYKEIKANTKTALNKYKSRTVFLSGKLASVIVQKGGVMKTIIALQTVDGDLVWGYLLSSTDERANALPQGADLTLFGKVEDFGNSYSVNDHKNRVKLTVYSYKND